MAEVLSISDFLLLSRNQLLIDVRSEGEYRQGHIPGAVNIPLLDNDSRAVVGTIYKQEGREAAVLKGFELAGGEFHLKIREVIKMAEGKEVSVYCWRGGMRSNIFSWLLSLAGFRVSLLKGGYKSYRQWALERLEEPGNILILGGYTGSGKTELLNELSRMGEYIIDLEALACHKGSAFGTLGQDPQPTNEQFENELAMQWAGGAGKSVWIENESRMIGTVKIPDTLFSRMRTAPVIEVNIGFEERVRRILNEYACFPLEQLKEATLKVKKRLGDLRCRQAVQHLEEGSMKEWAVMMLGYYDKFYEYGNSLRDDSRIYRLILPDESPAGKAAKVLELSNRIYGSHVNTNRAG